MSSNLLTTRVQSLPSDARNHCVESPKYRSRGGPSIVVVMQHWPSETDEFGYVVAGYLRHVRKVHVRLTSGFTYLTRPENQNGQLPHIGLVWIGPVSSFYLWRYVSSSDPLN